MTSSDNESRLTASQLEALARQLDCDPGSLTRLYEASDRFREICGDYAACRETLTRFRRLKQVDDARIQDYAEMRDQLERELRASLETYRGE